MRDNILTAIAEYLEMDPEDLSEDMRLKEDLELDAVTLSELIESISEQFSASIPDDELGKPGTVGELVSLIENYAADQES